MVESVTASKEYGIGSGIEKPPLTDTAVFGSVAAPWRGKGNIVTTNDPVYDQPQNQNTAETLPCKACGQSDCVNFACLSKREDEEITQKDSETLELNPGELSIQDRVENLVKQGEVYKAVGILEKTLAEEPTETLTDFADEILGYIQKQLPHETDLQDRLQNAIGFSVEALNPKKPETNHGISLLPELKQAA